MNSFGVFNFFEGLFGFSFLGTNKMDTNTFQRMTFDECCEAMKITKALTDPDEEEIVSMKNKWVEVFKPLLKTVINENEDQKIDSTDLGELWLFFVDGVHIRNLFDKLSQSELQELLERPNTLEKIIGDDCKEVTKCGVFLYQFAYYATMSKFKLEESLIRYRTIYTDDDPIIWLKNNNNSWKLKIYNKSLEEKREVLCKLWSRLYKVSNLALDPVFQK
jgi:hypothetical protein